MEAFIRKVYHDCERRNGRGRGIWAEVKGITFDFTYDSTWNIYLQPELDMQRSEFSWGKCAGVM